MTKQQERLSTWDSLKKYLKLAIAWLSKSSKPIFTRSSAANVLMIAFIIMTSVGAWQIYPPIGLIIGGVGCGIFGFILGLD